MSNFPPEQEKCFQCHEKEEYYNGSFASDGTFYCNYCLNELMDLQEEINDEE